MVVTSARFTTLATSDGSGGRFDVLRVTVILVVALLPAASVAAYVIVFAFGTSGTSAEKLPPALSPTGLPLIVSVVAVASVTVPLVVTEAALMTSPSAGCATAITGAWVSSVTIRTIVAVLVAASRAVTVSGFAPSASGTCPVNTPAPSTGSGIPFTSTVTGVASVTVPETVTGVWRVMSPSVGAVTASTGGWVSRVTVRVSVVAFPAASVATVISVFDPSVRATDPLKWPSGPTASGVPFTVTVTAVASVSDPDTDTVGWFVMSPLAGALTASTGGWVSSVTWRTWVVVLPAASVAVTLRMFVPSVRATGPLNDPVPSTANGTPFTLTVTAVRSVTVPATVTLASRVIRPSAGLVSVSTGGCASVAVKHRSRKPFGFAVSVMSTVLSPRWNVTSLMRPPTCWFSSLCDSTANPFTRMVALEIRWVPSGLPFTMHMRYGAAAVAEIVTSFVSVTAVLVERVNRSGPKTRKLASGAERTLTVTAAPAGPCTVTWIVSSARACTTRVQRAAPEPRSLAERIVLPFRTTDPPVTPPLST